MKPQKPNFFEKNKKTRDGPAIARSPLVFFRCYFLGSSV